MKQGFVEFLRSILKEICLFIAQFIPVDRYTVIFNNFNGRGYGDNPKYLCEELRKDKRFKLYWVTYKGGDSTLPEDVIPVKIYSIPYIFAMAKAKVIVNNVKFLYFFKKKKQQYYIQTWHGSLPLKFIEAEVENSLPAEYVRDSKEESKICDLFLVAGQTDFEIVKKSFWYENEIFKSGIPRNDCFFKPFDDKKIKDKLGIMGKKVVLYAPTFRDDKSVKGYDIDIALVLRALNKKTSDEWVALIRLHPNVENLDKLFVYSSEVINVCGWSDAQELSLISDLLITDYSSICLDFMLQRKPVILYTSDYDEYVKHSRPIRPLYNKLPFDKCFSNSNIEECVNNFDNDVYLKNVERFLVSEYGSFDDGHATERVINRIMKVVEAN